MKLSAKVSPRWFKKHAASRKNPYLLSPSGGLSKSGKVNKNAKGKAIGVALNFLKFESDGVSRTITTVDYKLN